MFDLHGHHSCWIRICAPAVWYTRISDRVGREVMTSRYGYTILVITVGYRELWYSPIAIAIVVAVSVKVGIVAIEGSVHRSVVSLQGIVTGPRSYFNNGKRL